MSYTHSLCYTQNQVFGAKYFLFCVQFTINREKTYNNDILSGCYSKPVIYNSFY